MLNDVCLSIPKIISNHDLMDEYGRKNDYCITYADWHPNPDYRIFKQGTLLSNNNEYPKGLVLMDDKGNPYKYNQ